MREDDWTFSFEGDPQSLRGPSDEPREDGREERPEKDDISGSLHCCTFRRAESADSADVCGAGVYRDKVTPYAVW